MPVELDHVFLWVSPGGPEADHLAALGVTEGPPNRHPGQGTACRRFFFANAYVELVWVENAEEAQGDLAGPLRLWERWSGRGSGACPFGVVFRPAGAGGGPPPFPTWEYRPPYLPAPLVLHAGMNSPRVEEPLLFYWPVSRRPDSMPARDPRHLEHPAGFRELTALRLFGPDATPPSAVMQAARGTGALALHPGAEFVAEIGFDGEKRGRRADLRPALPLVIAW